MPTKCLKNSGLISKTFTICVCALVSSCGGNSDSCSLFDTCGTYDDGGSPTEFLGAPACQAIGYSSTQKVANGEACPVARATDSSSVVKLVMIKGNFAGVCTGTVVSPTTILTAAHCFYGGVSSIQIITTVKGKQYTVPARSYTVHPEFGAPDNVMFNDIAIVRASQRLSAPTTPILLSRSPAEFEDSLVAGYGQTENDGPAQDNVAAGRAIIDDVSDNHIYINYTPSQAHPCKGDSGGALFVANGQGIAIVGVVSQSDPRVEEEDVCEPGDRTLYTNVRDPSVEAFIRANILDASFQ
jgi:secreted trypsin-like serine protease